MNICSKAMCLLHLKPPLRSVGKECRKSLILVCDVMKEKRLTMAVTLTSPFYRANLGRS